MMGWGPHCCCLYVEHVLILVNDIVHKGMQDTHSVIHLNVLHWHDQ